MDHEAVLRHECGHFAYRTCAGIMVTRIDCVGGEDYRGATFYRNPKDRATAMHHDLMSTLCAWLEEHDEIDELPTWPLAQGRVTTTDELRLSRIADELGWTEADYHSAIGKACEFTLAKPYQMFYHSALGALAHRPQLDSSSISRVIGFALDRLENAE